jgi:hypothetical protein
VLARMTACRSRGSACGLEGAREERVNKGLVEVLRTSMKTCGDCPRRPAAAALQSVLERASGMVFPGGRHLGFREGRRIDVPGWKGAQAAGIEALTRPAVPVVQEVSKGSVRRSHRRPTKPRCSSPVRGARAPRWQPTSPKPAACRQARSRWRSDDREVVRRSPREKRQSRVSPVTVSKSNAGGFSTALGRSLQRWCSFAGARDVKRRL